ncbi:T9SS type A sorting domain-containing protein, partial [Candidatus Omnitrophota bacterium]
HVKNGYLGWHYVNNIDTCLYTSLPVQLDPGNHLIEWEGRDQDGGIVSPGEYSYYIWGFDNITAKIPLTKQITPNPWVRTTVMTHDEQGNPLGNPIILKSGGGRNSYTELEQHVNLKWIVGGDPYDESLLETCISYGVTDAGALAILPTDHTMFFKCGLNNTGYKVANKWQWIPHGDAVQQKEWGIDGQFSYAVPHPAGWEYGPGCVSDGGDYLLMANGDISGEGKESELIFVDIHTGLEVRRLDLSDWFVDLQDGENDGQATSGPTLLSMWGTSVAASAHSTCLHLLVDVMYENPAEAFLWANSNGDYTGDHNFEEDSIRPWVCNDYNVGPYKYNFVVEQNGFSFFPCFDMGALSFGLFAPDGTGLGYHALANETAKQKYDTSVISYNSPYDGLLVTNQSAEDDRDGWFWVGQDSFKGMIVADRTYIFVSAPNGGDIWGTDTPHTISWRARDVESVRIDYSIDGGSNWITLVESIDAAAESYSWTPSGFTSSQCLVRIVDLSNAEISDVSNDPFEITEPYVRVISPNGGDVLEAGTLTTITWAYLGIETVTIEYSPDNSLSWTTVADNVDASFRVKNWMLPIFPSAECLIKITDSSNQLSSDTSDSVFSIKESFLLLQSPNGGEILEGNQWYSIAWTSSKGISTIGIEFSTDNGDTWTLINGSVNSSDGSYSWRILNEDASDCQIKIFNAVNSGFFDVSDGAFAIEKSANIWTTYTTADGLGLNRMRGIEADPRGGVWAGTFGGGASYFDGQSWTTYNTSNSGIESDDIIAIAVDNNDVVWFGAGAGHVSSFDGTSWKIHYDSPTRIHNMRVDKNNVKWIASYGNGLGMYDDSSMTIFTTSNSSAINNIPTGLAVDHDNSLWVGYYIENGFSHIVDGQWSNMTYLNDVPVYSITGMDIDSRGVLWMASSNEQYGVWSYGTDTGTSAYYGPEHLAGNIVWNLAVDYDDVVWFAATGGVTSFDGTTWRHYTTDNSGLADDVVIDVTVDTNNVKWFATVNGVSRFDYQSGPYISVVSPNGSELLQAGNTHDITWFSHEVERVDIDYSPDGGLSWIPIGGNIDASADSYNWVLPDIVSHEVKVRITDSSNTDVSAESFGVFTVSPPFVQLISPDGGERWAGGKIHAVSWISIGVENIALEFSIDNGVNWNYITYTTDAASGSTEWLLPETESAECKVRISDSANPDRTDESDGVFTISQPFVSVIEPDGGENWETSNPHAITWESDGVSHVAISYSVDGGLSWNSISERFDATRGSYMWKPLDVESKLCLVRISDCDKDILYDDSDDIFSVYVITSVGDDHPEEFAVFQNSPNPFNATTTIQFVLPEPASVTMNVYTVNGQLVDTPLNEFMSAGVHTISWNGSSFSTGIYIGNVIAGSKSLPIKMLLIK